MGATRVGDARFAPVDTDQFGSLIPGGSHVLFGIAAANRDPAVFADPDRFDIDRENKGTLTFGFGMHFCVGAHLARAELATALDVVLDRLDDLQLVERRADPIRRLGAARTRHPARDLHRSLTHRQRRIRQ